MKFLYHHHDTEKLLSHWSGDSANIVGSFFFWNLGTIEQKSQVGLSRAVLCQILAAIPSSIPLLLPRMWQEAWVHRGSQDSLRSITVLSPAKLAEAFRRLPTTKLRRWFCLFMDGLDEYEGNYLDGIAFIETLCRNRRIKVVLSSRPIPLC
jgi:hypothetical protein